jgi:hypothetical protein
MGSHKAGSEHRNYKIRGRATRAKTRKHRQSGEKTPYKPTRFVVGVCPNPADHPGLLEVTRD